VNLNATAVVAVLAERQAATRLLRLIESPLECLLFPFYAVNITFLDLDISGLTGPSEQGFICTELDCFLNHAVDVLRLAYADVVLPVTRGGLSSTVADALNALFAEVIRNVTDPSQPVVLPSPSALLARLVERIAPLSNDSSAAATTTGWVLQLPGSGSSGSGSGSDDDDDRSTRANASQCVEPAPLPQSVPGTDFVDLQK
jgi:hypothetical protein